MESELLNNLGPAAQRRAKSEPVTALDTNAEKALAKDRPDARLHSINGFLPSFAAKNFNLGAGFSGPNCYNTALVTTGGLPAGEVRYISSSEFEAILRLRYKRLAGPEPGALVVFEPRSSREHAAVYLFDNLIFQKKGYNKGYDYRIVPLDESFASEPFEWKPNPFDGPAPVSGQLASWEFYRLVPGTPCQGSPEAEDALFVSTVEYLAAAVLKSAPQWEVGRELGMVTEHVLEEMLDRFKGYKNSRIAVVGLAYAKLRSLKDQVFQSIVETHFSSRYASSRVEKITADICVHYNGYFTGLLERVLRLVGRDASLQSVRALAEKVKAQPADKCSFKLFELAAK